MIGVVGEIDTISLKGDVLHISSLTVNALLIGFNVHKIRKMAVRDQPSAT